MNERTKEKEFIKFLSSLNKEELLYIYEQGLSTEQQTNLIKRFYDDLKLTSIKPAGLFKNF